MRILIPDTISPNIYNQSYKHLNGQWSDFKNDKQRCIFEIDPCYTWKRGDILGCDIIMDQCLISMEAYGYSHFNT